MNQYEIIHADCLFALSVLEDNSVDSIVCDPPYELGFMGKGWDKSGIANNAEMWAEAMRVLKPGGHLLAFSGSRTYHRMACAIEDGGFEIRDQIMWVYGSGFPKSMNVSKAIDGHVTSGRSDSLALKEVNETRPGEATVRPTSTNGHRGIVGGADAGQSVKRDTPATPQGEQWDGWGTALKPAHEPICVARKPLAKGSTVAANVLAHGTGALNIDGCRVHSDDSAGYAYTVQRMAPGADQNKTGKTHQEGVAFEGQTKDGRWPANLIHDGSDEVVALFPQSTRGHIPSSRGPGGISTAGCKGQAVVAEYREASAGSAARFFYCAKTSKSDRNDGLGAVPAITTHGATLRDIENAPKAGNHHPTVKPTDLMAYLVRLVTPPGGLVLDPFMGSGSTGKACMREGFQFIGIEMDAAYTEIARARIEHEIIRGLA